MNHQAKMHKTINAIPMELWNSILLYAILGINELFDLSMASKQFRLSFFTKNWMSIIAYRNLCKSLKQILPFIEHNEEYFQDYVISELIPFCPNIVTAFQVILLLQ
jgi:hypothetical protein